MTDRFSPCSAIARLALTFSFHILDFVYLVPSLEYGRNGSISIPVSRLESVQLDFVLLHNLESRALGAFGKECIGIVRREG